MMRGGVVPHQAGTSDIDSIEAMVLDIMLRVRQLLNYRPDVGAIMDDLAAIKHLRGGPADAEAFHDFQVLQLAFKALWMHAFDDRLKAAAANLYDETVRHYSDAGLIMPPFNAIDDVDQLRSFIEEVKAVSDPGYQPSTVAPPSSNVDQDFPQAATSWTLFSDSQRSSLEGLAAGIEYHRKNDAPGTFASNSYVQQCRDEAAAILKHPRGTGSRLTSLIAEIGGYLAEPYAFDVFAPDSYNYGLLITYRQKWTPWEDQAGNLVATIQLPPGESRKYVKRRVGRSPTRTTR